MQGVKIGHRLLRKGIVINHCSELGMNYNRTGSVANHLSGNEVSGDKHRKFMIGISNYCAWLVKNKMSNDSCLKCKISIYPGTK